MIRYKDILAESLVDGVGLRVTAFLQGCPRHCQGCHNPLLLPMEGGYEVSEEKFVDKILALVTPIHHGITFSGGDPLAQPEALFKTIDLIKRRQPRLNIWVYTGYTYEEVQRVPVLSLIDVLVDGPFVMAEKDLDLPFRGSANQRIIDMEQTRQTGCVTVLSLEKTTRSWAS
jgi:anaerobic ribonucleoside-triphosphate reductase activating protein